MSRFAVAAVLLTRESVLTGNRYSTLILEVLEAESAQQAETEMRKIAAARYPERRILHILCADTQAPNE